jgi:ubiquinone/menaquinone biosynthesis C-methylase UbiE
MGRSKYTVIFFMACLLPVLFITLYPASLIRAQPARADINAPYRQPDLDAAVWAERFEVEGREVFDYRHQITAAVGIKPGQDIADVGAGTGLFEPLFAAHTGPEGTVYAIDIVPAFIEHIQQKAQENELRNISVILGDERSINLPEDSVDIVFVCDTYHHFDYYEDMLASIKSALRPGGVLFVVEFDKVPGTSDQWLLDHIRGTKEEFTREIEANGFRFTEEVDLDGLQHTFMRRFVKL